MQYESLSLKKQVSKLEQALQKQKDTLEEELRRTNEKLHLATEENNVKRQKIGELTATIRHSPNFLSLKTCNYFLNVLFWEEKKPKVFRNKGL